MAILFAGLFAFISACLIIVNEYLDFKKEIKIIEEGYIQAQQKSVETQLNLLYNITEYRYKQSQNLPKEQIYQKLKEDINALTSNIEMQTYLFLQDSSGVVFYRTAALSLEDVGKDIVLTKT